MRIKKQGIMKKGFCNFHYPTLINYLWDINSENIYNGILETDIEDELVLAIYNDDIHPRSRMASDIKRWQQNHKTGLRFEDKVDLLFRLSLIRANKRCSRIGFNDFPLEGLYPLDEDDSAFLEGYARYLEENE